MQSTGHSSTHALSITSTHGSAMMYVTARPLALTLAAGAAPRTRGGYEPSIPRRWSIVLGTEDLGYRVVVRRIIGIRDNRPIYGDLLGELVDVSETQITVRTRAGAVTVDRTAVTAAKRVPDRRRPSATEALERVAAEGWPAPDQQTLGDWLLRAAAGWTNRANSALAVGDPGRPLPDAVDAVVRW